MFPGLGSVVYFVAIYLPDSRLPQGAAKGLAAAARTLDPSRDLRQAREAFEFTPTAQNQMRLASAQLAAGAAADAATNYEACLKGPFAGDPEIQYCAACALVECGRFSQALEHVLAISKADSHFRAEQVSVLTARAYAGTGDTVNAKLEFESALRRWASFEVRAEYAIFAWGIGDTATASALDGEIDALARRWTRHTRELNAPVLKRLAAARAASPSRLA